MNQGLKNIFILLGLAALAYSLWFIREIIAYVLIALVLSLICGQIVKLLSKVTIKGKKAPNTVLALLSLLLVFGLFTGLITAFVPLISEQIQQLSGISPEQVTAALAQPIADFSAFASKYNLSSEPITISSLQDQASAYLNPDLITNLFAGLTGWVGNIFIGAFAVVFIAFYFIKDSHLFNKLILGLTPDKYQEETGDVLVASKKLLSRYFIGVSIQILCFSTLVTIGLLIIGVKNALLIGFFAGLINVIPYIGPVIGAGFALIITTSSNLQLDFYSELSPLLLLILLIFGLVQMLDNFLLQPLIYSKSVKAHPLEIFLVILIAGSAAGIVGMVVAIPFYSLVRIILKEFLGRFKLVKTLTKSME